jgi:hypothetical protein
MVKTEMKDRESHTVEDICRRLTEIWNGLNFKDVHSVFLEWKIRLNSVIAKRMGIYSVHISRASYRQYFLDTVYIAARGEVSRVAGERSRQVEPWRSSLARPEMISSSAERFLIFPVSPWRTEWRKELRTLRVWSTFDNRRCPVHNDTHPIELRRMNLKLQAKIAQLSTSKSGE